MNTESAPLFTPAPEWSGRSDGPGAEHARWHSVINQAESAPVTLLGFASDEGVLRNGGRQGAAAGPAALRSALGSLAVHHEHALADAPPAPSPFAPPAWPYPRIFQARLALSPAFFQIPASV